MMTTNMTRPQPIKTIRELKELNYTLLVLDDFGVDKLEFIASRISNETRPRLVKISYFDLFFWCFRLIKPNSNISFTLSNIDFKTWTSYFMYKPDLLEEPITTESYGIRMYKNNYMYRHVEDVMQYLIAAGIPQFHDRFFVETGLWRVEPTPDIAYVFRTEDLSFGFVIWLVTCAIATIVFILEVCWTWTKKFVRAMVGLREVLRFVTQKLFL